MPVSFSPIKNGTYVPWINLAIMCDMSMVQSIVYTGFLRETLDLRYAVWREIEMLERPFLAPLACNYQLFQYLLHC